MVHDSDSGAKAGSGRDYGASGCLLCHVGFKIGLQSGFGKLFALIKASLQCDIHKMLWSQTITIDPCTRCAGCKSLRADRSKVDGLHG